MKRMKRMKKPQEAIALNNAMATMDKFVPASYFAAFALPPQPMAMM